MTTSSDALVASLGTVHLAPINRIKPSPENPRKIPASAIEIVAKSLREFGWQQPIVVDGNHVIIAGHTRHLAAKSLGLTEVPVVVADGLTDEQVRAYRIADNRTGDYSSWDFPELVGILEELSDDFADVLGLADWQNIIEDFEAIDERGQDLDDLDPEVDNYLGTSDHGGFHMTVVFETEGHARRAAAEIMDMEGAVDVRDKH